MYVWDWGGGGYVKKTQKGLDEFTGVQQYSTTTNGLIQENTCIKMIINDLFFFIMAMAMFALNQLTCTFDIFYVLIYSCFKNKVECFL